MRKIFGKLHANDVLTGTDEPEYISGEWGNDIMSGGGGHDVIRDYYGWNTFDGGKGNDLLWSRLTPGPHGFWNTFVFRLGDGFDKITSLHDKDRLKFVWGDEDAGRFRFTEHDGKAVIIYGDGGTDDNAVWSYHVGPPGAGAVVGGPDDTIISGHSAPAGGPGGGTIFIGNLSLAQLRMLDIGFDVYGGDGDNTLYGAFADDVIHGGKGSDTIRGKGGGDILLGEDGDDTLHGGRGDDKLYGGDGNDTLYAGKGDDALYGGKGDDTLYGGKGNDALYGGDGVDRFVFNQKSETDTIHDFEDGVDILVIKGGLKFSDLDIKQRGDDAVISDPTDTFSIVLEDFQASLLTESDFEFIA